MFMWDSVAIKLSKCNTLLMRQYEQQSKQQ